MAEKAGNEVARTSAFPNEIWERGEDGESKSTPFDFDGITEFSELTELQQGILNWINKIQKIALRQAERFRQFTQSSESY